MEPIIWKNGVLTLLDQRKLPLEVVEVNYTDYRLVYEAIKTLTVRGAPAIGVAASYAYVLAAREYENTPNFVENMRSAKQLLASSRPTAVNLFWALDRMENKLLESAGTASCVKQLEQEALYIEAENRQLCDAISKNGASVIPNNARILTHCNAGPLACSGRGTALGVILEAHAQGKVSMVYADETRPLLQGARLTAFEMVDAGIPVTVQCDNMAASLMQQKLVDVVIVGCDRMAANGDFANKIGTYNLAVLAKYHNIPFYVALPSSSMDLTIPDGTYITVEQRSRDEVIVFNGKQTAPSEVSVYNPAFDITPHELISGIITEKGVLSVPPEPGINT